MGPSCWDSSLVISQSSVVDKKNPLGLMAHKLTELKKVPRRSGSKDWWWFCSWIFYYNSVFFNQWHNNSISLFLDYEALQCNATGISMWKFQMEPFRGRIAWNDKEPWLKHLLDGFLSHVFLGKVLGVPGACSPCSPLFSTLTPWKIVLYNFQHPRSCKIKKKQ